jgi:hypothetical protein
MASERITARTKRAASALDAAGIPYAIVGGNAVRIWVASRDPGAVRTTKDVDILVNSEDVPAITAAMEAAGFRREDLRSLVIFLDPEEPDRRTGIHLLFANQKTRPSSLYAAPSLDARVRAADEGIWVIDLASLVVLKLLAFRPKDQTHLIDMFEVGLIDDAVRAQLPPDLLERLKQVEAAIDPMDDLSGDSDTP